MIDLIQALADYERLEGPSEEAAARLVEHGFGSNPRYDAALAWADGEAVGYAITFETYSTFLALPTLYLEDIFVLPKARRLGVGRAIFRHLARVARDRGCGRIEWTALDWNELAHGFYRRIGGRRLDDWLHYRLDADGIERLAENT